MSRRNLMQVPVGKRYGEWIVLAGAEIGGRTRWFCRCHCGRYRSVLAQGLVSGQSRSCGCRCESHSATWREAMFLSHATHGMTTHPLYPLWCGINKRCNNPNASNYDRYGGRGIKVCDRWQGPDGFAHFYDDVGPRPPNPEGWTSRMPYWQLDRIDNDGHYEPGNVRWASGEVQANNRRTRT